MHSGGNLLRPLRYKNIQILRNPKQHVTWLTVNADIVTNNYPTKLAHREYWTKHQIIEIRLVTNWKQKSGPAFFCIFLRHVWWNLPPPHLPYICLKRLSHFTKKKNPHLCKTVGGRSASTARTARRQQHSKDKKTKKTTWSNSIVQWKSLPYLNCTWFRIQHHLS